MFAALAVKSVASKISAPKPLAVSGLVAIVDRVHLRSRPATSKCIGESKIPRRSSRSERDNKLRRAQAKRVRAQLSPISAEGKRVNFCVVSQIEKRTAFASRRAAERASAARRRRTTRRSAQSPPRAPRSSAGPAIRTRLVRRRRVRRLPPLIRRAARAVQARRSTCRSSSAAASAMRRRPRPRFTTLVRPATACRYLFVLVEICFSFFKKKNHHQQQQQKRRQTNKG